MLQDLHWPAVAIGWSRPPTAFPLPPPPATLAGAVRHDHKEDAMPVEKSAIGRTGEPVTMHVERGKIQELARAELMADLAGCR
jgi:hypothetical protein